MLTIYTKKDTDIKKILDVEARFSILIKSGKTFDDPIYYTIMKHIDNVKTKSETIIETLLGKTTISNLSTGCKSVLLLVDSNKSDYAVSIDECGENALQMAFKIAEKMDLKAYSSNSIKISDNNIQCMIDNKIIRGGYNIYNKLEEINNG